MKTTPEIPDFLFRRAKSVAAARGIPLRQLVTEAVQEKLRTASPERPWIKHLGKLRHLRGERKRIQNRVEEAFERIDREVSDGLLRGARASKTRTPTKQRNSRSAS